MKVLTEARKSRLIRFRDSLRYSTHCIFSPFDGFWDLSHEKRGTASVATFFIFMTAVISIWKLRFTSFVFPEGRSLWEEVNMPMAVASILVPLLIWCVSNWCLTTLFDGKGKLKDIYMATGYALTPYVIIQIPLIFISNLLTYEEAAFHKYFGVFSIIWCGFLFLASVMQVHDFTFGKAVLSIAFMILGMLVILFLMVMFFSLISDSIAYFVSIYKEISFRFY